jgi:hypothetical protein
MTNGASLSKIKKKLLPATDGQDVARLRTATVVSVNANGTLNLTLNGTTVSSVPRLAGAFAVAGSVVQVISYRGSLLVLGAVAPGPAGAMVKTGSATVGPLGINLTSFTAVVAFGVTFPAAPNVHVNLNSGAGPTPEQSRSPRPDSRSSDLAPALAQPGQASRPPTSGQRFTPRRRNHAHRNHSPNPHRLAQPERRGSLL